MTSSKNSSTKYVQGEYVKERSTLLFAIFIKISAEKIFLHTFHWGEHYDHKVWFGRRGLEKIDWGERQESS